MNVFYNGVIAFNVKTHKVIFVLIFISRLKKSNK